MRVHDMNWMQVEEYLRSDDRVVLPLGSTEQHGYLSLGVDVILSERVSVEAAEPLGVPVLPSLPYGLTPYFAAYPGSPSLRVGTYVAVVRDLLDSLHGQGFRRFLLVNGHGGNSPAVVWRPSSWPTVPTPRSSSTTGGTARARGRSSSRSTPTQATPRGSRTSRGRASTAWSRRRSESRWPTPARCGRHRPNGSASCSATGRTEGLRAAAGGLGSGLERWC